MVQVEKIFDKIREAIKKKQNCSQCELLKKASKLVLVWNESYRPPLFNEHKWDPQNSVIFKPRTTELRCLGEGLHLKMWQIKHSICFCELNFSSSKNS